ncbi:MAG: DUF1904 family protein [Clostridia bacterium]
MPHLEFKALKIEQIKILSKNLPPKLADIIQCPPDWFTFTVSSSADVNLYYDGEIITDTVFVYVEWFDRGQEIKDKVAKILTEQILFSDADYFENIKNVTVIFKTHHASDYFENGEHF